MGVAFIIILERLRSDAAKVKINDNIAYLFAY
jgi:hypothetical protein